MSPTSKCKNLLECAFYWESTNSNRVWLTQPMGGGGTNLKTWTWAEAVGEARKMAAYLKSLDLPKGSSIALCSKNCAYWLMADLAIWMADHVSVPIYPVLTADLVQYMLENSDVKLLFVGKLDPVWDEMKKGVRAGLKKVAFPLAPENDYTKWDDIIANHAPLEETASCQADETATIIYTSGSTGKPKGAVFSFATMYQCGKGISEYVNSHPDDRQLCYLPLAHVYERMGVQAQSLYVGFPLFFSESIDTFLDDLRRSRPTIFGSVPRLWLKFQHGVFEKVPPEKLDLFLKIPILNLIIKKKILSHLGLDQVRLAISGSAPIAKEVIEWYRRLGLELLEGYAMTENFSYSHLSRPGMVRSGYVGNTVLGVEHRISEEGEILVKSPGNMKGYLNMPEETESAFTADGFLRTGDLGEIDEMGRLKITGRIKELFKTSKGKHVAPAPIENKLSNHPLVENCYVTEVGYYQPHGVVMLCNEGRKKTSKSYRQSLEIQMEELLNSVNKTLPPFERLAFLAIVDDIWSAENGFLTPTLKIKRRVLDATYSPLAEKWYAINKPVVWQNDSWAE